MKTDAKSFHVLHVCDYAALYRGNFIDSLESLETYHDNVENFYLFPARAKGTEAQKWIEDLNSVYTKAYIQEKHIIKNFLLLIKILRRHKINRIVRHFSDGKIDVLIKLLFKGKHVVRFFHCSCPVKKNPIKRKFIEFVWRKNKLVGVSDAIANEIRRAHPKFSSHSIVNAIQFDRLDNLDPFEKAEGVSLLMMGWDYTRKGVDLAIKATQPLQEKYNITLQILGGKNEDKIKELAYSILGENVDWIRYLPPTNNIGTYYRANDIFLSPSRQEAFGYASIEAIYCGNSVVLSKVDGQGELNIDGAYWFESENVEEFRDKLESAIIELNSEEKLLQKEAEKAHVKHIYSLKEWSNKLVDLF